MCRGDVDQRVGVGEQRGTGRFVEPGGLPGDRVDMPGRQDPVSQRGVQRRHRRAHLPPPDHRADVA